MRRISSLAVLLVVAAPAFARADTPQQLPDGANIAGVTVGGMDATGAEAAVRAALEPVYDKRPVAIRAAHHDELVTPADAGLVVAYQWMVKRAFALASAGKPVVVPLHLGIAKAKLTAAVAAAAKHWYRAPRDATVRFGVTAIRRVRARMGRGLDQAAAQAGLAQELRQPTDARVVAGKLISVRPAVSTSQLRKRYPAYISVDRTTHKLRLFRALRLVRTYPVAVGRVGYATPPGLRHVLSKQRNPSWTAPNAPWAYPYQGQTFPPGDPRNPLREWFIALGDGIGIHGTSEEWSVGTSASHGCLRMHASDIDNLAPLVPIGTPVLIH